MKNKIFKYIGLEVLLLLALMLCGTIVVKIFNVALKLQFESIGTTGFIAGLCAWLILLIGWGPNKMGHGASRSAMPRCIYDSFPSAGYHFCHK